MDAPTAGGTLVTSHAHRLQAYDHEELSRTARECGESTFECQECGRASSEGETTYSCLRRAPGCSYHLCAQHFREGRETQERVYEMIRCMERSFGEDRGVPVRVHRHRLFPRVSEGSASATWFCDSHELCKRGGTGRAVSDVVCGHTCQLCDFDLCDLCLISLVCPVPLTSSQALSEPVPRSWASPLVLAGAKVVRGPHWKWGDQDAGAGSVGVVTGMGATPGWVRVEWNPDSSAKSIELCGGRLSNSYRWGAEGCYDLLVYDGQPTAEQRSAVETLLGKSVERVTDGRKGVIEVAIDTACTVGLVRWQWSVSCEFCSISELRLWDRLSMEEKHGLFVPFSLPDGPRDATHRQQDDLVGQTVRRGPDWKWGDQDCNTFGRQCLGVVADDYDVGWLCVTWQATGATNAYRWSSSVRDLEFIEDIPWSMGVHNKTTAEMREVVMTVLKCGRRPESPLSLLPPSVLVFVLEKLRPADFSQNDREPPTITAEGRKESCSNNPHRTGIPQCSLM